MAGLVVAVVLASCSCCRNHPSYSWQSVSCIRSRILGFCFVDSCFCQAGNLTARTASVRVACIVQRAFSKAENDLIPSTIS